MPPKNNKRGSTQVANWPKRRRTRSRCVIESASQGTEHVSARRVIESASPGTDHVSAPGADDNVACAPTDLDGDRPLPQYQAPATEVRLAGGQSQSSQGHFGNTHMNSETGRFQ